MAPVDIIMTPNGQIVFLEPGGYKSIYVCDAALRLPLITPSIAADHRGSCIVCLGL